jgi:DNA (cytosine-5)-methyltransferase 1
MATINSVRPSGANGAGSTASRFNTDGVLVTPDKRVSFHSKQGNSTAVIQLAKVDGKWRAEYAYQFGCGDFSGSTLPISIHSMPMAFEQEAIADAARRLLADVRTKCRNPASLPKVQQAALAKLIAWAEARIPAAAPAAKEQPPAGKRVVELCAGISAASVAMSGLGAKTVAVCEIDKAARETFRKNNGKGVQVFEDIYKLNPAELPEYDILVFGFPCQPFSMAGKRKGFKDKTRGTVFAEGMRIVAATKPALIICENVKGLATHDKGNTLQRVKHELAQLGYTVSVQLLNASNFGLPQHRERLFIVAHRIDLFHANGNPFGFPVGDDPSKVVADILEKGISADRCTATLNEVATPKASETSGQIVVGHIDGKDMQGYRVLSPRGKGATLMASSGGLGAKTGLYLVDGVPRKLTPRECARMQGFPDSFKPHSSPTQARKQFGNSIAVPVIAAVAEAAAKFF